MTPSTSLDDALALHEAGCLDAAEAAYRTLLAEHPDHADALHLLGVLHHQREQHAAALPLIAQAVALDPERALFHGNLGAVLLALGDTPRAIAAFSAALQGAPDHANTRFNLGVALETDGQSEAALACFEAAAERDPQHPRAALNAAIVLKKLGRRDEAIERFRTLLAREPGNTLADHHLAILLGEARERAPDAWLRQTFDAAAGDFDRHLTTELGYDTPARLAALLAPPPAAGWRVLDLGCGTGLSGLAIRPFASHLAGVDLSPKMLDRAQEKGIYDRLTCAEIHAAMAQEKSADYDLIFCTDVFIYLGQLDTLFAEAARLLKPGGRFAFSAEALEHADDLAQDFHLQATGRYAHRADYLRRLIADHDLQEAAWQLAPARLEAGCPVMAWLVVAAREEPSTTHD
ncbi:MAG TPA: methyltransferase domain-containing protein [Rhodocyclaceae bacterium]|nr:methyltransferase domain-containing protein [Rhodocyclaceae bacterium]